MANYDLGTAQGKIVIDASGVGSGVAQANQSLGRLGQSGGFNAAQFGTAMTLGVTAPILAIGGAALKTAIDFESAFAGVEKTVDGTKQQMDDLRQGIVDMSKEIPASTTEIAGVAEAAGQLGVATEDVLEFTGVMVDLGNATNITAADAATSIARIQNIMGSGVDTVDNFGATLVELGNNSATTESEILELANRLAGISAQSGITEDAMLAIAATMSSVGVNAESGGTSVTKSIKDFDSWSRSITKANEAGTELSGTDAVFADLIGNMDEFSQMTGDQQLLTFTTRLQEFEAEGGNVIALLEELEITEIRQSDALLKLVGSGDLLSDSLTLGAAAWEDNSALTEETGKRYATTASQLEIAKNNAIDILRILGEAFIPILRDVTSALIPVAKFVGGLATAFGALPGPVRKIVAVLALMLAAIGPVFFVGAKVAKTVKTITSAFKLLGLVMAVNPFVLIILALVALAVGLFVAYKKSEKFRKFVDNLWQSIQKLWDKLLDFMKAIPGKISGFFKSLGKKISDAFGAVTKAISGFFKRLPGLLTGWLRTAFKAVVGFLVKLPERTAYFLGLMIGKWIKFHIDLIKKIIEIGVAVVQAVIGFMIGLPGKIWEFLQLAFAKVVEWGALMVTKAIEIGTNFVQGLISFIMTLPGRILGFITEIITSFPGHAASFLSGALNMGQQFVSGLVSGIGDLIGLVKGMISGAIDAVATLAVDAFNKAKEVGSSLWNGFKEGLMGSPHTKVEYAVWDMVANVKKSLGTFSDQVRDIQSLSRSVPGLNGNESVGMTAVSTATLGSVAAAGSVAATGSGGSSMTIQGPLIGVAHIRKDQDIVDLARALEDERALRERARGRKVS